MEANLSRFWNCNWAERTGQTAEEWKWKIYLTDDLLGLVGENDVILLAPNHDRQREWLRDWNKMKWGVKRSEGMEFEMRNKYISFWMSESLLCCWLKHPPPPISRRYGVDLSHAAATRWVWGRIMRLKGTEATAREKEKNGVAWNEKNKSIKVEWKWNWNIFEKLYQKTNNLLGWTELFVFCCLLAASFPHLPLSHEKSWNYSTFSLSSHSLTSHPNFFAPREMQL